MGNKRRHKVVTNVLVLGLVQWKKRPAVWRQPRIIDLSLLPRSVRAHAAAGDRGCTLPG